MKTFLSRSSAEVNLVGVKLTSYGTRLSASCLPDQQLLSELIPSSEILNWSRIFPEDFPLRIHLSLAEKLFCSPGRGQA